MVCEKLKLLYDSENVNETLLEKIEALEQRVNSLEAKFILLTQKFGVAITDETESQKPKAL